MPISQENRLLHLSTPAGADVLIPVGFSGKEAISRLFLFHLEMISEQAVDKSDLVGKPVTLALNQRDGRKRYFHGFVSRFSEAPSRGAFRNYRAEVVPWLWFLTRTTDCRVFQNKTIKEIMEEIFSELGFSDYRFQIKGSLEKKTYCIQYRESAFNFLCRWMEEEGIFYFFEHSADRHVLVVSNDSAVHQDCPGGSTVEMEPAAGGGPVLDQDYVREWARHYAFRSKKITLRDYNFETPKTNLECSENGIIDISQTLEIYDYPGPYGDRSGGDKLTRLRMEEEEVPYDTVEGRGNCRNFIPGYKFTLDQHERTDQNATYILTSVAHFIRQEGFFAEGEARTDSHVNTFSAIPDSVVFRPERVTPKAIVEGSQTALVVGPSGEEIHCDQFGRVKCQFSWDRRGEENEQSSCWIRPAQPWAGKNWAGVWIPRIGQEVIVDFLEGDPDRPLIVGRVYNAEQAVGYEHPGMQTRSTFLSRSSLGGGAGDFNELRFEDKAGREQVFLHGQKDADIRIINDCRMYAGNDCHRVVKQDNLEVGEKNLHQEVKQEAREKTGQDLSIDCGGSIEFKVARNLALEAGMELTVKCGGKMVVEAGIHLTAKAAGGFVVIDQSGVTIKGIMVKINNGGSAQSATAVSPQAPEAPDEAATDQAGAKTSWRGSSVSRQTVPLDSVEADYSPPGALQNASRAGAPFVHCGEGCDALRDAAS